MLTSYLLPALWASGRGWPELRSFLSASLGVTHITASAGGRLGLAVFWPLHVPGPLGLSLHMVSHPPQGQSGLLPVDGIIRGGQEREL